MASDAAPHPDLSHGGPAGPVAERLTRAREVSTELEAIFGEAADEAHPPVRRARVQTPARDGQTEAPSPGVSLAGIGGVVAAALVGVAAGSLLARWEHPPHRAEPALTASPIQQASAPAPVLPPLQAPQALDTALAAPAPAPEPVPAQAAPSKPEPARARAAAAHRPKPGRGCCSYAQVQTADRRLRAAYDRAVRAGAPRAEIVAARNRWTASRRYAKRDPARLVASYRDIAADLDRAARRAQTYARADGGRFRPRYAAWWR